jgi:hypothetical protein
MAIKIDARELIEVLRLTPAEQNVLLMGRHGIGKSQIITRFFHEERQMPVIAFFLGQMSDPGDLIGLLHKDEATGRSVFLPPYWWPVDGKPIALFLDELNRARPEILQSVHELALNKTLAGKRLPAGSVVVSAVNAGDEYQLTDMDPALTSRFNLYEFAPTGQDWLAWAAENGVDPRVTAFIQQNQNYLDGDGTGVSEEAALAASRNGLVKTPDRRAWVKVSDFVKPHAQLEEVHLKIVAGMVGVPAALQFRKSLAAGLRISPEDVLLAFGKNKKRLEQAPPTDLVLLNERVAFWLNNKKSDDKEGNVIRKNFLAYLKLLREQKRGEVVAHLASLLEEARFSRAMAMLAVSAPIITELTDYVKGIEVA